MAMAIHCYSAPTPLLSRQQVHLSASSTFVCKASRISSVLYKFLHRNRGPYICCTQDGNVYHQRMSDDSKSSRRWLISQVGSAQRPISALRAFLSSASAKPVSFIVQPPPVIYVKPSVAALTPFDPSICLRSSLDPSPPWDPSPAPSELPKFTLLINCPPRLIRSSNDQPNSHPRAHAISRRCARDQSPSATRCLSCLSHEHSTAMETRHPMPLQPQP
ncbi:hypothetical protein O6H91_17G070200 [Diphasiastrum complanatum]|uniref:Uncharacterized protein n=1 Tax=Diphasiastrum complanatum TaxID=34168 RepID=A0ACC2B7V7_DIPCM|nr:hypothetical protein O6H91_17G070200 [Diphasiastrum complanatum]